MSRSINRRDVLKAFGATAGAFASYRLVRTQEG
jgi:hypothetical protein